MTRINEVDIFTYKNFFNTNMYIIKLHVKNVILIAF